MPGWVVNTVEDWLEIEQQNAKKPELPEWLFTRQMDNEVRNALKERYYEARTAWENRCQFNPKNDKNLRNNLEAIDKATTVREAQAAFTAIPGNENITGNIGGSEFIDMMNPRSVKLRLKGMVHMIDDIPQLRGQVAGFYGMPKDYKQYHMMAVCGPPFQGTKTTKVIWWAGHKGSYMYGPSVDTKNHNSPSHDYYRRKKSRKANPNGFIAGGRWNGAHELGHILQFMLDDKLRDSIGEVPDPRFNNIEEQAQLILQTRINAASVVQQAISELVTDPSFAEDERTKKLRSFLANKESNGSNMDLTEEEVKKGLENLDLVDYSDSFSLLCKLNPDLQKDDLEKRAADYRTNLQALHSMGLTSKYGASNISELFAEAFADYYGNKEKANPLSRKIVGIAKARTDETNKQEWVTKEREKLLKLINRQPPPSQ